VRRVFLLAFAAFFALSATWALILPLGTTIDEVSHMEWAAAVADGQLAPPRYDVPWETGVVWVAGRVRVPEVIADLGAETGCTSRDSQPAKCAPVSSPAYSTKLVPTSTIMSSYNPLYYLLVGWPVYVLRGLHGLYAMRLISALICSLLLACAAVVALRIGRLAFVGVLVGAAPMVLFQAGSVNPNGPEAAGGLLVFTALSALALAPEPSLLRSRLGFLALGAGVVTIVRPAGLEWLVVIAVMAALLLGVRRLFEVVRDRRSWPALGGLLAAVLYAAAWNFTRGGLNTIPAAGGDGYTLKDSLSDSVGGMAGVFRSMIGPYASNNAFYPAGTEAVWACLFGVLLVVAAVLATRRQLLVLGIWLAGVLLMPIVANAATAPGMANLWQGRYGLWFAAGLPVYAAMVIDLRLAARAPALARRLTLIMVTLVALGHLDICWYVIRLYGVGLAGSVLPHHFGWEPPMGWPTDCLLFLVGLALLGFLAWRGAAGPALQPGPSSEAPDRGVGGTAYPGGPMSEVSGERVVDQENGYPQPEPSRADDNPSAPALT
jgi:hypothetical protein